jgi:hypothetical protein
MSALKIGDARVSTEGQEVALHQQRGQARAAQRA